MRAMGNVLLMPVVYTHEGGLACGPTISSPRPLPALWGLKNPSWPCADDDDRLVVFFSLILVLVIIYLFFIFFFFPPTHLSPLVLKGGPASPLLPLPIACFNHLQGK